MSEHDHDHDHSHDDAHSHAHDPAHSHSHAAHDHGHDHGDDPFHGNVGAELDVNDLDPANKSLAEALRVSFGILKLVMIGLTLLFLFSGFFKVGTGQSAVVLRFGAVHGEPGKQVYTPGTYLVWPAPIDQVLIIPTNPQSVGIDSAFWYFVKPEERGRETKDQQVRLNLTPGQDGSLITGDKNIVHGKWTVNYSIQPATAVSFARNVGLAADREIEALPVTTPEEFEMKDGYLRMPAERRSLMRADVLVRSVAEEAIVGIVAGMKSDFFVSSKSNNPDTLRAMKDAIQLKLDALDAGITIANVVTVEALPPRNLADAFLDVSNAQADKATKIAAAQKTAKERLVRTAGSGYAELQDAIEKYEATRKSGEGVDKAYAEILAVLESDRVQGEAGSVIKDARSYQISAATNVKTEADSFSKLLPGYRASPRIVLDRLWQDTRQSILAGDVDTFYLPSDQKNLILEINRDPRVQKQREIDKNAANSPGAARP